MNKRPTGMFRIQTLSGESVMQMPNPDADSFEGLVATLVNSARNASGILTAQKLGRDQDKFTLKWSFLTRSEWENLLKFWNDNFTFRLTYYSPVYQRSLSRIFYISDRTYNYYGFEKSSSGVYDYNKPTGYLNCSASIVDTGRE